MLHLEDTGANGPHFERELFWTRIHAGKSGRSIPSSTPTRQHSALSVMKGAQSQAPVSSNPSSDEWTGRLTLCSSHNRAEDGMLRPLLLADFRRTIRVIPMVVGVIPHLFLFPAALDLMSITNSCLSSELQTSTSYSGLSISISDNRPYKEKILLIIHSGY